MPARKIRKVCLKDPFCENLFGGLKNLIGVEVAAEADAQGPLLVFADRYMALQPHALDVAKESSLEQIADASQAVASLFRPTFHHLGVFDGPGAWRFARIG